MAKEGIRVSGEQEAGNQEIRGAGYEDVRKTMSGFGCFGVLAAGGSGYALQRQDDSAKQSQFFATAGGQACLCLWVFIRG